MFARRHDGSAGKQLRRLGGPWPFLDRMRILAGGHKWEHIDMYVTDHEKA